MLGKQLQRCTAVLAMRRSATRIRSLTTSCAALNDRKVLLLGSGNVVQPVVDYLGSKSSLEPLVTIGSLDVASAAQLAKRHRRVSTLELDVLNASDLEAAVQDHDIVISLVPWQFHPFIAEVCIKNKTNMVTTSYVSDAMQDLHDKANDAGITILNEIGLDPGIDHLGAMKIIDDVKARGGKIESFRSYCGGLPAAESSFGPLGYKFSWFPKGVLVAGMSTATYRLNGERIQTEPGKLFSYSQKDTESFPTLALEGYPNRNSIQYESIYGIEGVDTIVRGTLRYGGFSLVMEYMRYLGLFSEREDSRLVPGASKHSWCEIVVDLLAATDSEITNPWLPSSPRIAMQEHIRSIGKSQAEEKLIMRSLERLGLFSETEVPKAGNLLDALCELMQVKLAYECGERDMVLLAHEFIVSWDDDSKSRITSKFVRVGTPKGDEGYTAMAETVGMPCALATELVLSGKLSTPGILRPVTNDIYEPLLQSLATHGIKMDEEESPISAADDGKVYK